MDVNWLDKRANSFERSALLEELLAELSPLMQAAEDKLENNANASEFGNVFIVGSPRSGTTLLMQLLAQSGSFAYPTNFLSRFYSSLGVGCKLQKLLLSPEYQFRDELNLQHHSNDFFSSDLGKTKGALAPHVFWYFWYHHFKFGDTSYLNAEQWANSDPTRFVNQLATMQNEFKKPVALKAMVINWNLKAFAELVPNSVILRVTRAPHEVLNSIYEARKRYSGSYDNWWSFKPPEYSQLKKLGAKEQVAGFYLSMENALDNAFKTIPSEQQFTIDYSEICQSPNNVVNALNKKLGRNQSENSLNAVIKIKNGMSNTDIHEWNDVMSSVKQKIEFMKS